MGCVAISDVVVSRPFSGVNELQKSRQYELGRIVPLAGYSITLNATNMFYVSKSNQGKDKRTLGLDYYWDIKEGNRTPRNRDVFFVEFIMPTRNHDIRLTPDAFSLLLNQQKYVGVLYKAAKPRPVSKGELCDFYVRDERGDIVWGHPNQYNPGESSRLVKPVMLSADQEYCFAIKFDTPPPMPENEFTLILGGIGKEVIEVPFKYNEYQERHN